MDSIDLTNAGVKGVVVNTYHLMQTPGIETLKKVGGIKKYMNFNGLVISDSGGWQVFSLIHRSKNKGTIADEGVVFYSGRSKQEIFTPEKSIQIQFEIGSDIIICLDDFTPPDADEKTAEITVNRTTLWAMRCKAEYERQLQLRMLTDKDRPHLYAVIQGGYYKKLRKKSAKELTALNFDGYGYGGYVVDADGNIDLKLSAYISNLLPQGKPKFALGMGRPIDIVRLYNMGWNIFDCTLPTRDARHKRLYELTKDPKDRRNLEKSATHSFIYINKSKYDNDFGPISNYCDCIVCKNFSRSYLRHLFLIKDTSAYRLASIHNLRIYTLIVEALRAET